MIEYKNIKGTQPEQPKEIEVNVDTVYVRTNIIRIEEEGFKGWQYDEKQYDIKEYISFIGDLEKRQDTTEPLVQRVKTATEIYEENKDKSDILLDDLKLLRLGKLKEECNDSIEDGFTVNGAMFGFNTTHDQSNFTQQLLLVVAGKTEPIQWKTKNIGVIELTPEQFKGVCNAAELHKRTEQEKYWLLEQQINAATTKDEVKEITWNTTI